MLGATRAPARTVVPKTWVQLAAYLTPLMTAVTGPVIASLATWHQGALHQCLSMKPNRHSFPIQ